MPEKGYFSIRRTFRRRLAKIMGYCFTPQFAAIFLVIIIIFLIGGGVYAFLLSRGSYGELLESMAVILIYALGTTGILFIYRSIKYRRNPSQASLLVKIGVVILIAVFIILELYAR